MVKGLRSIATEERYGYALALLAVFYVIGNAAPPAARLADLIFILILLLITTNPLVPRILRWTSYAAAAFSAGLTMIRLALDTTSVVALDALSTLVVMVVTILAILARLAHSPEVTSSTVMGAFLCYALIGFAAAYLYIAVDALTTGDFFAQGPQPDSDFVYFSLVTLTTVGYGDLSPGTDLARRLVVLEALIGQVFLVVLVARLVSLWKPPNRPERTEGTTP